MEISQSSARSVGATKDQPVQGRVESVKDGVATVRVSNQVVVQASVEDGSTELVPGATVALFAKADGTLVAKSVASVASDARGATLQLLMDSLGALLGEKTAAVLAKKLASGDLEGARKQIAEIWQSLKGTPAQAIPAELRQWMEAKMPAMLSRPGEAPVILGGAVAVALGTPTSQEGEYFAQVAGQPARLLGPSDLTQGSKGLWQSRSVPGGGAVWAPVPHWAPGSSLGMSSTAKFEGIRQHLPERISADSQGATALLEWAGVEATPEASDSLGRFLASVASEYADVGDREQAGVMMRQTQRGNDAAGKTGFAGRTAPGDHSPASEAKRSLRDPARQVPDVDAVLPESVGADVGEIALPDGGAVPVAKLISEPRANPEVARLPRAVAERALVAWAQELPDEPSVRRSVMGDGPGLAEAVEKLTEIVAGPKGELASLRAVLSEWATKEWAEPAGLAPARQNSTLRERMAEAVFEALSKTDLSRESAGLRQALQQTAQAMVMEALEPPREPSQGYPPAVFQARNANGAMEEGRIVVHDRRSKKRDQQAPADHHTVEIEMRPATLGHIKAKLDLRGKVLTTRLEAKEAETASLIESRVHELRDAFKKIGLEPAKIEVERPTNASRIDPRKRGSGTSLDVRV